MATASSTASSSLGSGQSAVDSLAATDAQSEATMAAIAAEQAKSNAIMTAYEAAADTAKKMHD